MAVLSVQTLTLNTFARDRLPRKTIKKSPENLNPPGLNRNIEFWEIQKSRYPTISTQPSESAS